MIETPWQILVVDDEEVVCQQIKKYLDGETLDDSERIVEVTSTQDFKAAFGHLESKKIDVVVLDVRNKDMEDSGITTLAAIRASRFVPVVFYTGLPHLVKHLKSVVVRSVEKTEGLPAIEKQLREIVATGIPAANRAILRHVEHVQRDFMWTSHELFTSYNESTDKLSIALMMARRLAASLQVTGIEQLAKDMGHAGPPSLDEESVHPMFFYIIPPIAGELRTGSLYRDAENTYWVTMTNACDLVVRQKKGKACRNAEHILMAHCRPLTQEVEYTDWKAKPNDAEKLDRLTKLIKNNRGGGQPDRYFFLPAGLRFPDLLVDVQNLKVLPASEVGKLECLAQVDSPYLESMIARFTRYYARIGTPDIHVDAVLSRLK